MSIFQKNNEFNTQSTNLADFGEKARSNFAAVIFCFVSLIGKSAKALKWKYFLNNLEVHDFYKNSNSRSFFERNALENSAESSKTCKKSCTSKWLQHYFPPNN